MDYDYHHSEFIGILQVYEVEFKFYKPESIGPDDPRFEDGKWEFNEDFLIEKKLFTQHDDDLEELINFIGDDMDYYHSGKSRSVHLNDFDQPVKLETYLEVEFEKFRISLTTDYKGIKANEVREMIQEVKYARNELEFMHRVNRGNNWFIFDSLLQTKIDFCLETIRFLRFAIAGFPKEEIDNAEYYFTIMPKCDPKRHYILLSIHQALEAKGYVNCTPDAFKAVFVSKNPQPIGWLKPLRHLTYMIKAMTGGFLIEKIKPSNYFIAEKYFNIYKKGVLFPPKRLRHDDDPNPKDKAFIDNLLDNAISTYV